MTTTTDTAKQAVFAFYPPTEPTEIVTLSAGPEPFILIEPVRQRDGSVASQVVVSGGIPDHDVSHILMILGLALHAEVENRADQEVQQEDSLEDRLREFIRAGFERSAGDGFPEARHL